MKTACETETEDTDDPDLSIPLSYFKISEEFQVDTGVRDGDPRRQEQRRQTKTQPSSSTFHWAREPKKTSIKLNLEYWVYDQLQPRITKPVLHDYVPLIYRDV